MDTWVYKILAYERCNVWKTLQYYEEIENRLIKVSGFNIEELIELFEAGYTLSPPKYVQQPDPRLIR